MTFLISINKWVGFGKKDDLIYFGFISFAFFFCGIESLHKRWLEEEKDRREKSNWYAFVRTNGEIEHGIGSEIEAEEYVDILNFYAEDKDILWTKELVIDTGKITSLEKKDLEGFPLWDMLRLYS